MVEGKRHGLGVILYKTNRIYEGEWEHDLREGKGYEQYQNGNVYFGEFVNGKAHGKGRYECSGVSAEFYEGEWY